MYIDPFVAGLITGTFGWFIVIVILAVIKAMGKKS